MSELQLVLEKLIRIEACVDGCATKEDMKSFATKEDLKSFATKEDMKSFATKEDLKSFATKEDLKSFATKGDLRSFATKEDLKSFATKEDLKSFATKADLEMLEFVLREEAKTIYDVAIENKNNIEELMKYRNLFAARSEEVAKLPMLDARIEVVEDAVRKHENELKYLKQA